MNRTVPLRHLADVRTSSVDKHSRDGELPVRLCNYVDVYRNDKVQPNSASMWATATIEEINRFRLSVGDTLLTKDSEDPSDIGVSAFVEGTAADFVCGYHLAIARPDPRTHSRYLTWALRSRQALHHLSAHAAGISRYGLAIADLRATPVPAWGFEEQRRIADFLDDRVTRIDQIISARLHQVGRLEELVLGMVWSDLNGVGTIPLRRVLCSVRTGGTPPQEADDECGLPWYTPGDFLNSLQVGDPTRTVDADAATIFPARSVLIVGIGATTGKVAWLDHNASGNQQITCVVPNDELLDGRFLLHELASRATELRATAPSATLPIINNEVLKSLRISYPPVDEQRRLAKRWGQASQQTLSASSMIRRTIALLEEYKQSLITAAVTGELDVTTASSGIPG